MNTENVGRPTPRRPSDLPAPIRQALAEAQRIEWLTLGLRASAVAVLFAALGGSQALTAIWLKSVWAVLPPIAFLVARRVEQWPPRPRFPYGFYRAGSIAFLAAALALVSMGLYLVTAGVLSGLDSQVPGIARLDGLADLQDWPGWWVIAALAYSVSIPFIAGARRLRLAVALHDKILYADATMGRASWLAGAAAILGVFAIAFGYSGADTLATIVIGADILGHGLARLRTSVCDLLDEVPRQIGSNEIDPLGPRIRRRLEAEDDVLDARVRLREEGRRLTGVGYVCLDERVERPLQTLQRLHATVDALDWRLLDFELVPVDAEYCAACLRTPD